MPYPGAGGAREGTLARKSSRRRSSGQRDTTASRTFNPALQAAMLEVVDTQLREGTPPQMRQALDRLLGAGYPDAEARFVAALGRLPKLRGEAS